MRRLVSILVCSLATIAAADDVKPPPVTPARLAEGRAIYEGSGVGCFACHGLTGEGNGPVSFAFKPPPRNFTRDPFKGGERLDQVFATITAGLPGTAMVGYPKLTDDERWSVAAYVLTFRPAK